MSFQLLCKQIDHDFQRINTEKWIGSGFDKYESSKVCDPIDMSLGIFLTNSFSR